jgi:hypothetical protein
MWKEANRIVVFFMNFDVKKISDTFFLGRRQCRTQHR